VTTDRTTGERWSWSRTLVLLAGLAALAFGAQQLLSGGRATALTSSIPWLAGVLVVHDAVVAPVAVGVGLLLRRTLGAGAGWAAPVVAAGLAVGSVLTLVAAAALAAPGVPGNPTVLPRDYGRGLLLVLAGDVVVTACLVLVAGVRRRRRAISAGASEAAPG
jgi:hypothetical protein